MYKLKDVARRAAAIFGAAALMTGVVASALPGVAHADPLNPLTERTLTLTSSSPGWNYLDGSGNTTYAPPGSGPNGRQTGERFSFKMSSNTTNGGVNPINKPIKAFTLQYCTAAAGLCLSPGDAAPTVDVDLPGKKSNLNINYTTPACGTDFEIYVADVLQTCGDWAMTVKNEENSGSTHKQMNNFITLANANSTLATLSGVKIDLVFKASATNYITNPGSGAFFVKINTYDSEDEADHQPATEAHVIDGGVTVANVMTDSITIQTKVLETMAFSVGTINPDTEDVSPGEHGPCDSITTATNNQLLLGDPNQENSLQFNYTWETKSYWRLSSNSSGGATVYYSGNTLANTVGDDINAIGTTAKASHPGMEQFGLAINSTADPLDAAMTTAISDDQALPAEDRQGYKTPTLSPLVPTTNYGGGAGDVNADGSVNGSAATPIGSNATFAFSNASLTSAVPIAAWPSDVIECSTAKMRYIANISANTPAGVYTSKINYLAAPQY